MELIHLRWVLLSWLVSYSLAIHSILCRHFWSVEFIPTTVKKFKPESKTLFSYQPMEVIELLTTAMPGLAFRMVRLWSCDTFRYGRIKTLLKAQVANMFRRIFTLKFLNRYFVCCKFIVVNYWWHWIGYYLRKRIMLCVLWMEKHGYPNRLASENCPEQLQVYVPSWS